jgi:hypothetical protein
MATFSYPPGDMDYKAGWMLARYDETLDHWFGLTFIGTGMAYSEQLIPGRTYQYQIWMFIGRFSGVFNMKINDTSRISIIGAKR